MQITADRNIAERVGTFVQHLDFRLRAFHQETFKHVPEADLFALQSSSALQVRSGSVRLSGTYS